MNILPKKRWHVRTKDNIARVRRDEAKAAEEEKERERRAKLAEQEARTAFLRQRAKGTSDEAPDLPKINFIGPSNHEGGTAESSSTQETSEVTSNTKNLDVFSQEIKKPGADIFTESGNINFFKDLETGVSSTNSLTNKEHEAEERAEKEKYEKQIGLLTYLGQDTLEATKSKEWYHDSSRCISSLWSQKGSKSSDSINSNAENETENIEVGIKYKSAHDPLNDMIKYAGWKPTKSSSVVGETAATESCQAFSLGSNNSSSSVSPKEEKRLKKLLKKRHKLDKKISSFSRNKLKKSKKKKKKKDISSDDSDNPHASQKRKRAHEDDETNRSKKTKRHRHSSKKSKSKHSRSAKKRSHSKSPSRSDDSSDSSSQSGYTTDSEAEREEREQQRQKLAKMREARLAREAAERQRERRLLAGQKPDEEPRAAVKETVTQKYSSQFNPLLARQNRGLQSGTKYF